MSDFAGLDVKNLREALSKEDINALADAGLLDPDTVELLLLMESAYQPYDAPHHETGEPAYYVENTELWVQMVKQDVTNNLRKAVQDGNWEVIAFALGRGNVDDKVRMDFGEYEKHRRLLLEPGLVELMYAGMGGGKTMTAVRQSELWMMLRPNGRVLTNIKSWSEKHPRVDYVGSLPELMEKASENPNQYTLAVIDELGIDGNAYGGNEAMEQAMHRFVRLMRKEPYKLQLIGISQRPTDIHPTLRNDQIAVYAMKEGNTKAEKQKHMVVYNSTTNKECTEPDSDDKACSLYGIGMPELPPDTNDRAEWDWGTKKDWAALGLIELEDEEDTVHIELCQGTTKADDPCPQPEWNGTGYCYNHQNQRKED